MYCSLIYYESSLSPLLCSVLPVYNICVCLLDKLTNCVWRFVVQVFAVLCCQLTFFSQLSW